MDRALEGIVVLDLTQFAAGPYCTMLLGDAGARVIKVEPPAGEPYRHEGPSLSTEDGSKTGSYILRFNRNKESIVLDLKDPRDLERFMALVSSADVLVQNFRPGTVQRLGIDYATLSSVNPKLVYASITGFGAEVLPSPFSEWSAFAIVAEAVGGVMDQIGEQSCPPHWSGVSLGDLYAGGLAVSGILMALLQRNGDGMGQHVDISMTDCMISLDERSVFKYALTGVSPQRGTANWAPFGAFEASDGWLAIGVIGNAVWKKFCSAIGRPELQDDERLLTGQDRAGHLEDIIRPAIDAWLAGRSTQAAAEALNEAGVPAGPVATAKDVAEPHTEARQMLVDVSYGAYGTHKVVGSPIKLSNTPYPRAGKIPLLGEHTEEILRTLGGVERSETTNKRSA